MYVCLFSSCLSGVGCYTEYCEFSAGVCISVKCDEGHTIMTAYMYFTRKKCHSSYKQLACQCVCVEVTEST